MNVKHLGLIALTAAVAAGLAGMSTSNAGAAVAAAPANCVIRTYNGNYVTAVGGGGRETDTLHTDATRIGSWERSPWSRRATVMWPSRPSTGTT